MKIIIAGGAGFIGTMLAARFTAEGHAVTVLDRGRPPISPLPDEAFIISDLTKPGAWQDEVTKNDVVINLAGASIFRRWTERGKKLILDSRLLSTRNIVDALALRPSPGIRLFSVSGVGYYGYHGDELLAEDAPPGDDFIASVAAQWEEAALRAQDYGARVVVCRFGHVFGKNGGVLPQLALLSRLHLGTRWGNGLQWVSWVHEQDIANAIIWMFEHKEIAGPVNLVSPHPISNGEMMATISQSVHAKPLPPRIPKIVLRLAAGEFASVFINGQRVSPKRLLESGFTFQYPLFRKALESFEETI